MMGQLTGGQERLFYSFNLEDHVPEHHLLRGIDRCLNLRDLRQHLAEHYSHTGRPSIDPELMIRMLIIGYSYGIRSERRLCEEVHLNLAYRWFCRLSLDDAIPDHSTFSKNRHGRFRESGVFRWMFDEVVHRCMAAGLVKGEGFAVDASLVAANASHQHSIPVGEHFDWTNPEIDTRAMREYLAALDDDELAAAAPRKISLSDPQSRWTAATGGIAFFAYSTNYLIDTAHGVILDIDTAHGVILDIDTAHGVILDVEATPANRTAEVESTKVMVDRVEARFDLKPERLIGDTAYGTAPMLGWMVEEKAIEPHVPVWDKTERKDGSFQRDAFQWDEAANEYRPFKNPRTHITNANTIIYRSSERDCAACPMKADCCPNMSFRKITRSIHEAARDVARHIATTPEYQYQRSRCERKKVEMLFAHLKSILKLDRLRLRGLSGATDEFTLLPPCKICGDWPSLSPKVRQLTG
jgi:transposase